MMFCLHKFLFVMLRFHCSPRYGSIVQGRLQGIFEEGCFRTCLKNRLLVAQAPRLCRPATRRTEEEQRFEPMETAFSQGGPTNSYHTSSSAGLRLLDEAGVGAICASAASFPRTCGQSGSKLRALQTLSRQAQGPGTSRSVWSASSLLALSVHGPNARS